MKKRKTENTWKSSRKCRIYTQFISFYKRCVIHLRFIHSHSEISWKSIRFLREKRFFRSTKAENRVCSQTCRPDVEDYHSKCSGRLLRMFVYLFSHFSLSLLFFYQRGCADYVSIDNFPSARVQNARYRERL